MPPRSTELPSSLKTLFSDTPEISTLGNGLTVVHQHAPAHPVVSVQAWVKTGSIHEQSFLGSGLSHFLEHMLFKGTHTRGPGQIAEEVQAFGGQINAYTAFDRTVYYIDGPSESLGQMLDLLSDQTLNASLPVNEVAKESEVILREIDMTMDDPDRQVGRSLFATAYREHPFQYPVIGIRSLFEQVGHDCLSSYYSQRYLPNNMVLSIAGQYDPSSLLEQIEATFGKYPRGTLNPVQITPEPRQLAYRECRGYGDYNLARGLMAFKIPDLRDNDAPALDIMAAIIGSGHSGRLRQRIREDLGLVHHINASVWNPADPGLLFVQFQSDADKAAAAENAIIEFCDQLGETGFTEEEVEKARRFAIVSEVHSRQTVSGLASRLGLITAVVGDLNYPKRYFERIQKLTPTDLQKLAGNTFRHNHLSVSTLLPETHRQRKSVTAKSSSLAQFQEKTLPNGARLLWQTDPRLPRTWLRFSGLGGPMAESVEQRGATSLLTTMLARDTEFKSAREVAESLESEGGFMMDASGDNTFSLTLELMPEGIDLGIETLQQALFHPAFKESTLERERAAQIAHLRDLEDDILDYGRLALRKHFFGNHPFASHPCGSIESTGNLDATSLKELYQRLLVGPNSVLVISGDFDQDAVLPKLESLLEKIPAGKFDRPVISTKLPAKTGNLLESLPREQAIVLEAYPDVGAHPEESLHAQILDEIFSDMAGPLFKAVREDRSLAYFVGASRLLGYDFGCFCLYAGTRPDTTGEVYAAFDNELDRLRSGNLSQQELDAARTRLVVHNRFSLQKPGTRAKRAVLNVLHNKPAMHWLTYEERINKVQIEDLVSFAAKHLAPENRLRLTVTPKID